MATLVYNGVTLEFVRTASYSAEPVTDPTGKDMECVKVTLEVEGVLHDRGLGTGKGFAPAPGPALTPPVPGTTWGTPGDRLGISLVNLRERLLVPRQQLRYYVGNDLVLASPQLDANFNAYATDVKGGPFPKLAQVYGIIGDRAAWVRYRVETYVSSCDRFVMSNRWRLTSHTDEHGYDALTIQGRASFRHDFLVAADLHADDFRRWLILPVEPSFKRVGIDVVVSEDGAELLYTVHDRQTNYGTGKDSSISKIDCIATSGVESEIKNVKDMIRGGVAAVGDALRAIHSPVAASRDVAMRLVGWFVPTTTLACRVEVTGQPHADRFFLARVAHAIAQDRLRGFNTSRKMTPVSMWCHVDWSTDSPPHVSLTAEYMASPFYARRMFTHNDALAGHNWNPVISGAPLLNLGWTDRTPRVGLPGADGTRGAAIGRLVAQVLSAAPCAQPGLPPAPGTGDRDLDAKNTENPYGGG